MKSGRHFFVIAAVLVVALRLVISLRGGAVSGDDMKLLADSYNWWKLGDPSGLVASDSSAGLLYSGYHNFVWAALAALVSFRLTPLYVAYALMMLVPALLLGWQFRHRAEAKWMLLLAISSPLVTYFSVQLLPFWCVCMLGGTVAMQVAVREERGDRLGAKGLIFAGAMTGYLCGAYPSLSALAVGLFVWLIVKKRPVHENAAYILGCVLGYLPFIYLLIQRWDQLAPHIIVGKGALSFVRLFGGIFRYIGTPPVAPMNSPGIWAVIERGFGTGTVILWVLLLLGWIVALVRRWKAHRPVPGPVLLAVFSFGAFIPFTLITHTESWFHQAANLWWIAALVVPWTVYELAPRFARSILATIVVVNILGLGVMFGPRVWLGTTTEEAYSNSGRGPSWWMQERIADQIVARAQREIASGINAPLAVQTSGIYFLTTSLPILIQVQHPELADKVKWVGENWPRFDLRVMRDRRSSHRLRLVDWPGTWHRPTQTARNALRITSEISYERPIQVSVDLPDARQDTIEVVDAEGNAVPFCRELGGMDEHRLWLRLAKLGKGVSTLWVYHGGMRAAAQTEKKPQEIFDFFEGFDDDLRGWETVGNGVWSVSDGVCRPILPATEEDNTSAWLLIKNLETNQGLLEARLRYVQFPAKIDAGIAFAVRRDDTSYLWNLNGYGVTVFSKFDGKGTPLPYSIAASSWFWKAKAGRWSVIGAQWNGSLVKASVDGRTVIDIISPGESGLGRIGLGAKRGTGVLTIEYDWVRLRTNFSNLPPSVAVEPEEWFQ